VAVQLRLDRTGRVYFTLTCDACQDVFTCYDDACYSFESLRTEAMFAGWDAPARPEQRYLCPNCLISVGDDQPSGPDGMARRRSVAPER
jgi:hypothetical protein